MAEIELPEQFPYHQGMSLTIEEHVPPEPFGSFANIKGNYHRAEVWEPPPAPSSCINLKWCLEYPLAETEAIHDPAIRNLHILEQVACGTERSAQVVRCYLDTEEETVYIAKIFDPLFYPFNDTGDFTYQADLNYAFEAEAYQYIGEQGLNGRYTPKYWGPWTFSLPISGSASSPTRPVRMVLLEEIQGYSMHYVMRNALTSRIPPLDRLAILAEIFEMYSRLECIGVTHRDLASRNVILSGLDFDDASAGYTKPRVVIIDFNFCFFNQRKPQPIDPKVYFGKYCPMEWTEWAPNPHRYNGAAWRGWVRKLWNGDEFQKSDTLGMKFDDGEEFVELEPRMEP